MSKPTMTDTIARSKRIEKLRMMLRAEGISADSFSTATGCSLRTARDRLSNPETITLGELDALRLNRGMRVRIVYEAIEF